MTYIIERKYIPLKERVKTNGVTHIINVIKKIGDLYYYQTAYLMTPRALKTSVNTCLDIIDRRYSEMQKRTLETKSS